ncbi:hypothetical protein NQT62_08225 [Limnobacter humi]|uniref:Uncharacterized protein n=1 Tax=Limnobacter humi TaxID=1778671 RepID=A0ABT1WFX5_9BURK|nr:hypothetical protein [Limnobacter humi]MCQ8896415.1 hypothetical protein [Limnobacter humi]
MRPHYRQFALLNICFGLTIFGGSTPGFSATWQDTNPETVSTFNLDGLNCSSVYSSVSSPLKVGLCRKSPYDSLAIYTSEIPTNQNLVHNIQNLGDAESGAIRGFVRAPQSKSHWNEILVIDHRDEASCYGTLIVGIKQGKVKIIGTLPFSVSNTDTDGSEQDDCLGPYGTISDNELEQPVLTFKAQAFQQMEQKTGFMKTMNVQSMHFLIGRSIKRIR